MTSYTASPSAPSTPLRLIRESFPTTPIHHSPSLITPCCLRRQPYRPTSYPNWHNHRSFFITLLLHRLTSLLCPASPLTSILEQARMSLLLLNPTTPLRALHSLSDILLPHFSQTRIAMQEIMRMAIVTMEAGVLTLTATQIAKAMMAIGR